MRRCDLLIVGAGAAGMFCAGVAAQRGARVILLDHAERIGEKIRISGGGRCNFTNLSADRPERFVSQHPKFSRHALRAYPPARFIALLRAHGITWHEKHRGQLFCDDSAERIVSMLRREADVGGVEWLTPCRLEAVRRADPVAAPRPADGAPTEAARHPRFVADTAAGPIAARHLVIATGGLSIPKIGATDLGYRIARQFGHAIVEPRPGLVPLTFDAEVWRPFAELSGLSLEVDIGVPSRRDAPVFREDLLFTHRGLSGPAVLQASSFWARGDAIEIDLAPDRTLATEWTASRKDGRGSLAGLLAAQLPRRLAQTWLGHFVASHPKLRPEMRVAEVGNRDLAELAAALERWRIVPSGTEGYRKAEVTVGGVDVAGLDARTMQSQHVPGLYFIGEVVDVTGWLGGYNFQWAWASAHAAAMAATA
ncbi:MAG TPA: NAD(P)/FAD-dependent oxidoreductase [Quisquiliibacterium sp.]|nr:NAD(P)/FAD-dependent oxidoreductase [Quisquiliibacterium sp.]